MQLKCNKVLTKFFVVSCADEVQQRAEGRRDLADPE